MFASCLSVMKHEKKKKDTQGWIQFKPLEYPQIFVKYL